MYTLIIYSIYSLTKFLIQVNTIKKKKKLFASVYNGEPRCNGAEEHKIHDPS